MNSDFKNNSYQKIMKQLMVKANIENYRKFSQLAQVSERQFYRIENGLIANLTLDTLTKIAQTLNLSVTDFISQFTNESSVDNQSFSHEKLSEEYQKLKQENNQIAENLQEEWQQATISVLESLLLQIPTISKAVEQNPQLPASRLLPLLKPLNQLLSNWEIETIGKVGEIVNYNPLEQELIDSQGININEVSRVKIRYVGYQQKGKLLYRAKVSPIFEEEKLT